MRRSGGSFAAIQTSENPVDIGGYPGDSQKLTRGKGNAASAKNVPESVLKAGPCAEHCVSACGFDDFLDLPTKNFFETVAFFR